MEKENRETETTGGGQRANKNQALATIVSFRIRIVSSASWLLIF